jgi:outer membrane biosynthesis protein TonB
MSEKNKYTSNRFRDFLRYRRDGMTREEKNSFEREFQKDPFAEEAAEGFETISPEEIQNDLADLKKRIKARSGRKKRYVVYRIAASVAVLMIISSIFIVIERDRSFKQTSVTQAGSESLEIPLNKPLKEETAKTEVPEKLQLLDEKKTKKSIQEKAASEKVNAPLSNEVAKMAEAEKISEISEDNIGAEKKAANLALPSPVAIKVTGKNAGEKFVSGKVMSTGDNLPLAGATISVKGKRNGVITDTGGNFNIVLPDTGKQTLVANYIGMYPKEFEAKADSQLQIKLQPDNTSLSEVVVTGYGISRSRDIQTGYIQPQPVNGRSDFNKYIRENIHWPDSATSGQRVVVLISFLVQTDGSLDSLKIIKSPGKFFSDEAIRLIKSGPAWKPGLENGKPVEDMVTLRIVFR